MSSLNYIKCSHCGKSVLIDWTCESCRKRIEYDFKQEGDTLIRYNPHKPEKEGN